MKILPALACLFSLTTPALAEPPDYSVNGGEMYGSVRGWSVVKSDLYGCSAYPEAMPVVLNTPPAGGWQLIFPYADTAPEGDYAGMIHIDNSVFTDTYYGDSQWMYSPFPLVMRKTLAAGQRMTADFGHVDADVGLEGATAAMLKLEECWQSLSGWTPASSRAGTFALSGD